MNTEGEEVSEKNAEEQAIAESIRQRNKERVLREKKLIRVLEHISSNISELKHVSESPVDYFNFEQSAALLFEKTNSWGYTGVDKPQYKTTEDLMMIIASVANVELYVARVKRLIADHLRDYDKIDDLVDAYREPKKNEEH